MRIGVTFEDKIEGTVVIGALEGDVRDIGKSLARMTFEIADFAIHDLGQDVPLDEFVESHLETDADGLLEMS